MDKQLLKPTRNKYLVATTLNIVIIENLQDKTQIDEILQSQYINVMLNTFKYTRSDKKDQFLIKTHQLFDSLEIALKTEGVETKTKISILKKLLFENGTIIFEKITYSKLIQHITLTLDSVGIRKLVKLYKDFVTGQTEITYSDHKKDDIRTNVDKIYIAQLYVKLIGHASIQNNVGWRIKQAKFLVDLSLFRNDEHNISNSMAGEFMQFVD